MSTVVTTVSGSVYYIAEPEKMISGGIFRTESVQYEALENLEVGKNLVIRLAGQCVRTTPIEKLVRGTQILTRE